MRLWIIFALLLTAGPAWATTYFISAAGSDGNNGTSSGTPWQTITKVNSSAATFLPGDSILFRSGDKFAGMIQFLNTTNAVGATTLLSNPPVPSGSSAAQLTIGSYGAGAKPIIDGADPLSVTWTLVTGTTYSATIASIPDKIYEDAASIQSTPLLPVPNAAGVYSSGTTYNFLDLVTSGTSQFVYGNLTSGAGHALSQQWFWAPTTQAAGTPPNTNQTFSTTNTGLQNVEATPGSWYASGTTIWVNLPDGTNPSGHTFEATTRMYGIEMLSENYITVTGLAFEHQGKSGILATAYSDSTLAGHYWTNEFNQFTNNSCWNFGDITADFIALQVHENLSAGCFVARPDGQYDAHLIRGIVISNNTIGTMDTYFAEGLVYQAGIMIGGTDQELVSGNTITTINGAGIISNFVGLYVSVSAGNSNLGRVTGNVLTNNQSNIQFAQHTGGRVDHNTISYSFGQGVQSGGGSTSTATVPQMFDHNLIYHLGKGATGNIFNGFDCNGSSTSNGLSGGRWIYNTVYDTNSAAITLEVGCDSATVENNIFDQNVLEWPAHDVINPSLLMFFQGTSHVSTNFSNNLWSNGTNANPYHSSGTNYTCSTFFAGWPDVNSLCTTSTAIFTNPAEGVNDFTLAVGSPALGMGLNGTNVGSTGVQVPNAVSGAAKLGGSASIQ